MRAKHRLEISQLLPICLFFLQSPDEPRTALGGGVRQLPGGGGIFKSAAVAVLRQDPGRLMTTGEITRSEPTSSDHLMTSVSASFSGTPCLQV